MRLIYSTLVLSLLLSACQQTDEIILPAPPETEPAPVERPTEAASEKPSVPQTNDTTLFRYETFQAMPYRLLVPANHDPDIRYPLHIFLHGIGERGTDNEKQLSVGGEWFIQDSVRESYPAFIVFPQCPPSRYWFDRDIMATLKALIDTLQQKYGLDEQRITIGGFSMGAYGTFALTARYPGLFKSAVAISGDGDEEQAEFMAKTKWRIFAGEKDNVVASDKTKKMATALQLAGAAVDFTLYPDADHTNTWQKAFSEPDFFRWIFADTH